LAQLAIDSLLEQSLAKPILEYVHKFPCGLRTTGEKSCTVCQLVVQQSLIMRSMLCDWISCWQCGQCWWQS
jgi:hypothetical protein